MKDAEETGRPAGGAGVREIGGSPAMRVGAVVLAAGESRRMGRDKLTLPYGDSTILGSVLRALMDSTVESVTVVLGRNWEMIQPTLATLDAQVVVNPRPERGMLSSAQWGLAHLRYDLDGILFVLGDQPSLTPDVIDRLIEAAGRSSAGLFLPVYEGKRGHPLLVRSRYKEEILRLQDSGGLNQLLRAHPNEVELVPVSSPGVAEDIDTPEEYERALKSLE